MKRWQTPRRERVSAVLRDDAGSAAASLVFVVLAGVLSVTIIGACLSNITVASAAQSSAAIDAAVNARVSAYAAEASAGQEPSIASICYPALETCVSVTGTADTEGSRTLDLAATYQEGATARQRSRVIPVTGGTHITSFADDGTPIWTSQPTN